MGKVLIAMSGGVDSSVAAYLMQQQGWDCMGATMTLYRNEDIGLSRSRTCCSLDDVEDALEMEFDEDDKDNFDTLNGFLISRLGHLPEDDEKGQVVFGGYRFSIVKAENKIIQTVTAERDAGPEHEKENEG